MMMRALVSAMPRLAVRRQTKTATYSGLPLPRMKTWIRLSLLTMIS